MTTPFPTPSQESIPTSSTTLWATGRQRKSPYSSTNMLTHEFLASKEWVIPPKLKPGRKPKKDLVAVDPSPAEVGSTS